MLRKGNAQTNPHEAGTLVSPLFGTLTNISLHIKLTSSTQVVKTKDAPKSIKLILNDSSTNSSPSFYEYVNIIHLDTPLS